MQILHLVAVMCYLATVFAVSTANQIKWCVISNQEQQKCNDLARNAPAISCVRRASPFDCIIAIKAGEADAITLSEEYIFKAGQNIYNLVPIIAESYGGDHGACSYSVAVARKGTMFGLRDLRRKKSCHTGLDTLEGWLLPIGTMLSRNIINWAGSDFVPLQQAVSEYFSESCVPGASANLCQLCGSDCSKSSANQYFGGTGTFKCLAEGQGEVAFMNPADIPTSEKNNYELLCQDNNRQPVENYKTCNLGQGVAHAVVTRASEPAEFADYIFTTLTTVRGVNLVSSEAYRGKDLMFSDSTAGLMRVPPGTDRFFYLGAQNMAKLESLFRVQPKPPVSPTIRWCTVGHLEQEKCDRWTGHSLTEDGLLVIECHRASSVEECFKKIMWHEADAIAVDGGQVYTAGKCGLVPAMVEQYDEGKCSSTKAVSYYYSVAVIRRGSGVTWYNLNGKRSCHPGMGTSGWYIPMGRIHQQTRNCDFSMFFSSGCAPGANLSSTFCHNCKGSGRMVGSDEAKCKPNTEELYYGDAGAFRCLAEGAGDVAFIKHTIVGENTDGHNTAGWASTLRSYEFELICPGNPGSVAINDYELCNLARVPADAVMTRPEIRSEVIDVLNKQQAKFGINGNEPLFRMFQSLEGKNHLFEDSTKCLQETQSDTYESFLGSDFLAAIKSLRECTAYTPDLEISCSFQSCQ